MVAELTAALVAAGRLPEDGGGGIVIAGKMVRALPLGLAETPGDAAAAA